MRVRICENYAEMSRKAALIIAGQVAVKPDSVLGLATGSTPEGAYSELIKMYRAGDADFSRVTTFNLDEYYPISPQNPQSYRYFMEEKLFRHINVPAERIHIPNGEADDPEEECEAYDIAIKAAGGVDLQVLGIGQNGHIGFNEPGKTLYPRTHLTELTESTVRANSRFFSSADEVPRQALTMGMETIFSARKILLLASGAAKRDAVAAVLSGGITTAVPATLLNLHPDAVLLCDKTAAGMS